MFVLLGSESANILADSDPAIGKVTHIKLDKCDLAQYYPCQLVPFLFVL